MGSKLKNSGAVSRNWRLLIAALVAALAVYIGVGGPNVVFGLEVQPEVVGDSNNISPGLFIGLMIAIAVGIGVVVYVFKIPRFRMAKRLRGALVAALTGSALASILLISGAGALEVQQSPPVVQQDEGVVGGSSESDEYLLLSLALAAAVGLAVSGMVLGRRIRRHSPPRQGRRSLRRLK